MNLMADKVRVEAPKPPERVLYVDATDQILGRLASIVAKKLLEGYRVYIFNAEKAVVSGDPKTIKHEYLSLLELKVHVNPYKWGPHRPRSPISIVKQAVENMLPKEKWRGKVALTRLRVYIGVPEEFKGRQLIRFPEADASKLVSKYIRVEEIAKAMGWKGVLHKP